MKLHPLIWILCVVTGLALGIALGAHVQVSSLKTQMNIVAKAVVDQQDRCVCVEKKP